MDEGAKNKQGEGDIKEKLVISTMNKDLVSRNEKVQVQVNPFESLVQLVIGGAWYCKRAKKNTIENRRVGFKAKYTIFGVTDFEAMKPFSLDSPLFIVLTFPLCQLLDKCFRPYASVTRMSK